MRKGLHAHNIGPFPYLQRNNIMKKKHLYLAAILLIAAGILAVILLTVIPRIQAGQTQNKLAGVWHMDAFGGNGGEWVTFRKDGVYTLHEEYTTAEGEIISQDSTTYGESTYTVLSPTRLKVTVTSMGTRISDEIEFRLEDDHTLIMDGKTYVRQE